MSISSRSLRQHSRQATIRLSSRPYLSIFIGKSWGTAFVGSSVSAAIYNVRECLRCFLPLVMACWWWKRRRRRGKVTMLTIESWFESLRGQSKATAERKLRERQRGRMASTACFLHHIAPLIRAVRVHQSARNAPFRSTLVVCKAEKRSSEEEQSAAGISRRLALTLLVGAAAVGTKGSPADAAYGEAANVFGKPKENTDFLPYNGDGFKLLIPSKWNPSKEVEYPGQILRYEDNFDSNSNVSVMVTPTDKKSIADYGSPEEFLSKVDYLLGKQVYSGKTDAEGGFDRDAVATANILESSTTVINGKQYHSLSVLTRTADGDEGGKHQLIIASVSDGKLYICKAQAGDKRWFKGAQRFVESTASSFSLA